MKKILIITILLLLFIAFSAQAYETIIEDYPKLPACEGDTKCKPGGEEEFGLPEFIKYIFLFSLGIVGITGFLAIIIAGFELVTATGNPQKAAQAKDRITSALLGLLLLLGSWLILHYINPDLLKLGITLPW